MAGQREMRAGVRGKVPAEVAFSLPSSCRGTQQGHLLGATEPWGTPHSSKAGGGRAPETGVLQRRGRGGGLHTPVLGCPLQLRDSPCTCPGLLHAAHPHTPAPVGVITPHQSPPTQIVSSPGVWGPSAAWGVPSASRPMLQLCLFSKHTGDPEFSPENLAVVLQDPPPRSLPGSPLLSLSPPPPPRAAVKADSQGGEDLPRPSTVCGREEAQPAGAVGDGRVGRRVGNRDDLKAGRTDRTAWGGEKGSNVSTEGVGW